MGNLYTENLVAVCDSTPSRAFFVICVLISVCVFQVNLHDNSTTHVKAIVPAQAQERASQQGKTVVLTNQA